MLNLLSVTFRRAFFKKRFYIGLGFILFIGDLLLFLANDGSNAHVDNMPFIIVGFLPMLIGITSGLYISQDYTNNTIRNKIIAGHSRTNIYLSNLITSMLGTLIIYGSYVLLVLGIGSAIIGVSDSFDMAHEMKSILMFLGIFWTFTSLTVMFCMMLDGISGTVISALLYILFGLSTIIMAFVENETLIKIFVYLNPTLYIDFVEEYARGTEIEADFIDIYKIVIASIVYIVASTGLGIFVFNKKDIK